MNRPLSIAPWLLLTVITAVAQESPKLATSTSSAAPPPLSPALGLPQPGPTNDAPYAPQPIVQGGVVVPLYPGDSSLLKKDRVREAEQYNMSKAVPGRISSIVNIHNPSIEVHTVEGGLNTGAAVILAAGGGHAERGLGERGLCSLLLQFWANEYFTAMLQAGIPNIETHIYGNGRHPGDALSDGTRMSAGLADRNGLPFGKWQDRYIDWFRDLGFLQKPGVETKAARDIAAFLSQPPRGANGPNAR